MVRSVRHQKTSGRKKGQLTIPFLVFFALIFIATSGHGLVPLSESSCEGLCQIVLNLLNVLFVKIVDWPLAGGFEGFEAARRADCGKKVDVFDFGDLGGFGS